MKKVILLYVCFSGLYAVAQDERQVVIIERNQPKQKSVNDGMPRRLVDLNQVFKFDPVRMAIGEINFSYERVVGQQSSIEVELGPTVSNLGRNRPFENPMGERRNSEVGVFASAAFKFYPLDGRPALNQLYISPKFKYRRYNESTEAPDNAPGIPALPSIKGYSNEAIFTFNFGYQQWLAQRFSFDYYIGFGLGSYNGRSHYSAYIDDGNGGQKLGWVNNDSRYTRFVGTIGIKVGIGK